MPLSTYDELKASMADWLVRTNLTAQIPDFIRMNEAQIERNPKVRTRQMIARAVASTSAEFTVLPIDFLALHNVQLNTNPRVTPIYSATMAELDEIRRCNPQGGVPERFCIVGDTIELAPVPTETLEIEIVYYQRIPKLSASQSTNWVLDNHPDLYLYGSLMQAAPYLKNDERVPLWLAAVTGIVEDLDLSNETATKGRGPLNARLRRSY